MDWNQQENKELVAALLALRTSDEARRFLRDLMTENEIREFGKRFKVAQMLSIRASYPEIQRATGLSQTTIARVSKWLQEGEDGYRLVIDRLHHLTPISRERGLR
ncbi:MAG: YerC/YecD family TrpR-related protein [Candidatus Paceibacterota bacterium]|jgi:TrpR-related protein YerC/YecD